MRDEENFDPEKFRIPPEQQSGIGAAKPKRHHQRGKFVQVPELWREQLCIIRAHGSTFESPCICCMKRGGQATASSS